MADGVFRRLGKMVRGGVETAGSAIANQFDREVGRIESAAQTVANPVAHGINATVDAASDFYGGVTGQEAPVSEEAPASDPIEQLASMAAQEQVNDVLEPSGPTSNYFLPNPELDQPVEGPGGDDRIYSMSEIAEMTTQAALAQDNEMLMSSIDKAMQDMISAPLGIGGAPQFDPTSQLSMMEMADFVGQKSAELYDDAMKFADIANQGRINDAMKAEGEAKQAWQDANIHYTTGFDPEEWKTMQDTIARGNAPDATADEIIAGHEAAKLVREQQEEHNKPNPFRLWNDMDGWQQALFILINTIGAAGSAVSGMPTPLDVAMDMMERDYQAQKDEYIMEGDKVKDLRSAYSIAASKTDNEIERHAMAKNMMLESLKMKMQEAGFHQQADQMAMQQAQLQQQWKLARMNVMEQRRMGAMKLALQLKMMRMKQAAGLQANAPPYGTTYLQGAPPLDSTSRHKAIGMLEQYQRARQTLQEWLAVRQEWDQLKTNKGVEWAKTQVGLSEIGGRLERAFANYIDAVRAYGQWGARFEATEAEMLIPGYASADAAEALDPFGISPIVLQEQLGAMPRNLSARLTPFGIRPGRLYGAGEEQAGPAQASFAEDYLD